MEQLTVNENVTTVITASETIRLVDISTDKVVGDKPIENVIRVKPKEGGHEDGAVLAIVTVVTERYRSQYALIYTTRLEEAVSDKEVQMDERNAFHNPAVSMSTQDMVRYARRIWNSPAKYHSTRTNKHHATMRLNNVYAVGNTSLSTSVWRTRLTYASTSMNYVLNSVTRSSRRLRTFRI